MVGTAVLMGAALGTGTALMIAMTVVMYRYYSMKRKAKEWQTLDQKPFPPVEKSTKPLYALPKTVRINYIRSF